MADWFRSRQDEMEVAQRKAAELHASFGRRALSYCIDETITAESKAERRALRQIAKVLRHMPNA